MAVKTMLNKTLFDKTLFGIVYKSFLASKTFFANDLILNY